MTEAFAVQEAQNDLVARQAFAKALDAIKNVARTQTADTGRYTYRYADLADVLEECKRVCRENGLTITQWPSVHDGHLSVGLMMMHINGGRVTFEPLMMVLPKEAQAYGSALTYARRYQLLTVFGIAPEDDDGREATVAARTQPGQRTEAERMIRERIATMDADERGLFTTAFKAQFGMGLSELPASKHGDALTWTKEWTPPDAAVNDERPSEKAMRLSEPETPTIPEPSGGG